MTDIPNRLADVVSALVSRETENPPGSEAVAAMFIHDWLAERGVDAELIEEPDTHRPQVAAGLDVLQAVRRELFEENQP